MSTLSLRNLPDGTGEAAYIAPTADTVPDHGIVAMGIDSPLKKPRPKSEVCPKCGKAVDRLVPLLDGSGSVCLDCYTASRQSAPDTSISRSEFRPAVIERINPTTGEIFYEVRPLVFDAASVDAIAAPLEDPDGAVIGFLAKWYLEHQDLLERACEIRKAAAPIDLRPVVTEYIAAAPILDITARIASKAAWNDEATKQARRCAEQLTALYSGRYDWKTGTITPRKDKASVVHMEIAKAA